MSNSNSPNDNKDFFTNQMWPFSGKDDDYVNTFLTDPGNSSKNEFLFLNNYFNNNKKQFQNTDFLQKINYIFSTCIIDLQDPDKICDPILLLNLCNNNNFGVITFLTTIFIFYIYVVAYLSYNASLYFVQLSQTPASKTPITIAMDNFFTNSKIKGSLLNKSIFNNIKSTLNATFSRWAVRADLNSQRGVYDMTPTCNGQFIYFISQYPPYFAWNSNYINYLDIYQGLLYTQLTKFMSFIFPSYQYETDTQNQRIYLSGPIANNLRTMNLLYFILGNYEPKMSDIDPNSNSNANINQKIEAFFNLINKNEQLKNNHIFPLFCCGNEINLNGLDKPMSFSQFFTSPKTGFGNFNTFLTSQWGNFLIQSFNSIKASLSLIYNNFFGPLDGIGPDATLYTSQCNIMVPSIFFNINLNPNQSLNLSDIVLYWKVDPNSSSFGDYNKPSNISQTTLVPYVDLYVKGGFNLTLSNSYSSLQAPTFEAFYSPSPKSVPPNIFNNIFDWMCDYIQTLNFIVINSIQYSSSSDTFIFSNDNINDYKNYKNSYCGDISNNKLGQSGTILDFCRQDMCENSTKQSNGTCNVNDYNPNGYSTIQNNIKNILLAPFNKDIDDIASKTSNLKNNYFADKLPDPNITPNFTGSYARTDNPYTYAYPMFYNQFCGILSPPDKISSDQDAGVFEAIDESNSIANIYLNNPQCVAKGVNTNAGITSYGYPLDPKDCGSSNLNICIDAAQNKTTIDFCGDNKGGGSGPGPGPGPSPGPGPKIKNFWDNLSQTQRIILVGGIVFIFILIVFLIVFLI